MRTETRLKAPLKTRMKTRLISPQPTAWGTSFPVANSRWISTVGHRERDRRSDRSGDPNLWFSLLWFYQPSHSRPKRPQSLEDGRFRPHQPIVETRFDRRLSQRRGL